MGGTLVAEAWPEGRRNMGAGLMETGYYFEFFLAGIFNHFIGENYGWRAMFALADALPFSWASFSPACASRSAWKAHVEEVGKWSIFQPLEAIFSPPIATTPF
jgi:MFS family permease